jgi:hypothetical protein
MHSEMGTVRIVDSEQKSMPVLFTSIPYCLQSHGMHSKERAEKQIRAKCGLLHCNPSYWGGRDRRIESSRPA